ncbi:Uma2 family endonuclease, partial [Streptomyces sp. NPDC048507]|uniref:Uma2 family endonuclease n=1 Tax=Streptomyces sp. NPDC048507 TaxID=3365560 RepID=UPI0037187831
MADGLNVVRLRRHIEAQTPEVMALNDTNMGDSQTGLTKVPDLMVIAEEDTDDTPKVINSRDVLMVVEVVSRTHSLTGIRDKLPDYPKMGVPLYVVVDPRKDKKSVAVHSEPSKGPERSPQAAGLSTPAASRATPRTGEKGDAPERRKAPHQLPGAGLSHNDCSAASYSPTGSP